MEQKDQKKDKSSQWYWQLFSADTKCIQNKNELKEISPDVLPILKQTPNIEDINTEKFQDLNIEDLNELKL